MSTGLGAKEQQRMWHAPLSARHLAGRAQIGDVQLLHGVVGVGHQVVIPVPVRGLVLLARVLGGLLLLELPALYACELGPFILISLFLIFFFSLLVLPRFFVFVAVLGITTTAR